MSQRQPNRHTSYGERSARAYDRIWRRYTERSLAATMGLVDVVALTAIPQRQARRPQALDVACGTGVLLRTLLTWIPDLRAVGVDASPAMLAQARITLADFLAARQPPVQLIFGQVGAGPMANLPLAAGAYDLITFTNAFHYLPDAVGALAGLLPVRRCSHGFGRRPCILQAQGKSKSGAVFWDYSFSRRRRAF